MDSQGTRRPLLAKVHIARKDLGLSEEDYRSTLRELFGVASAAQLTDAQLAELLAHFLRRGWRGPLDLSDRPAYLDIPESDPYVRQKRYILALARRLDWSPGVLQRYMRAKVRASSLANLHDPAKLRVLARDLWGRCLRQGIDPGPKGGPKADSSGEGPPSAAEFEAGRKPKRGKRRKAEDKGGSQD